MLISYNWIKDWIPELSETPEEVAEALSNSLAEVEGIEHVGNDSVLEIENKALSHRGDLFGQLGIAREVAAILQKKFITPDVKVLDTTFGQTGDAASIQISLGAGQLSQRVSLTIVEDIQIGESPQWLKDRLISLGQRPINNIVDVTNYLMHKHGQPLHAYDLDKLNYSDDGTITIGVRLAKDGEQLELLDGSTLSLSAQDLVITNNFADQSTPISLAGIRGGRSAEITKDTTRILFEAANFDMFNIRATSRRFGIRTDASLRFEKGIDPNITVPVLQDAICMITGNADVSAIADKYNPISTDVTSIEIEVTKTNYYLNIDQSQTELADTLTRLGCKCDTPNPNIIQVSVPSYRKDLKIKEDIYEEIGRIYNYNNITPTIPTRTLAPNTDNPMWRFKNTIRDILTRTLLDEVITYSFVDESQAGITTKIVDGKVTFARFTNLAPVHLQKTLSPEMAYVRSSLLPSLSQKTIENAKRFEVFDIFEIDPVTIPQEQGNELPDEPIMLAIVSYRNTKDPNRVIQPIKSIWLRLMSELGVTDSIKYLEPIELTLSDTKGYAFAYEFDLRTLIQLTHRKQFKRIPLSMPTKQDMSFIIASEQTVGPVTDLIRAEAGEWLTDIELLDIYQSPEMQKEKKKSVTVRLIFQHLTRSIADHEINPIREKIEQQLLEKFDAVMR